LIEDKGHFLTIESKDPISAREYLFLPGGKVESSETPRQAAEREAREETGAILKSVSEHSIYQEYDFLWKGQDYWSRTHFHWAELDQISDELSQSPEESYLGRLKWLKAHELVKHYAEFSAIQYAIRRLAKI
jgi:8-oxo-dGTP pyrophosphatase MutT (NUDIX family)